MHDVEGLAALLADASERIAELEAENARLRHALAIERDAGPDAAPSALRAQDPAGRWWTPAPEPEWMRKLDRWTPEESAAYDALVRGAARRRGYLSGTDVRSDELPGPMREMAARRGWRDPE